MPQPWDSRPEFEFFPPDFLEHMPVSRGNVRRFLEEAMFPPVGPEQQRQAGEASARAAVASSLSPTELSTPETDAVATSDSDSTMSAIAGYYHMDGDEFVSGLRSVGGARRAAGGDNKLNEPDPDVPQDEGVAAFFDVDNTLIQGASIILFARGLARRKFFSARDVRSFLWKQVKFRLSGKENADDVAAGREQALAFVKGRSVDEMTQMAQEIFDLNISDRVWPGTKQLADMHLAAGHQVWLVTATPVQLAQIIAKELGFTGALGTVAEVDEDGKFTGALVGDILHGLGKKHAVAALAAYEGLDLDRATAYSDSINDLPMLSMVGTAVAVNPDRALRREAKKNGWEIRDYRVVRRTATRAVPAVLGAAACAAGGFFGVQRWKRRGSANS